MTKRIEQSRRHGSHDPRHVARVRAAGGAESPVAPAILRLVTQPPMPTPKEVVQSDH